MAKRFVCKTKCYHWDRRMYEVGEYLRPGVKPSAHFVEERKYVPPEEKPAFTASGKPEASEEPETLSEILDQDNKANEDVAFPDAAEGDTPSVKMFE